MTEPSRPVGVIVWFLALTTIAFTGRLLNASSPRPLAAQAVATTTTTLDESTTLPTTTTSVTLARARTTGRECLNSHDPKCGAFRWVRDPHNAPMTMTATLLTTQPRAGERVYFRVVAGDADDQFARCGRRVDVDDSLDTGYALCVHSIYGGCAPAYGPWDLPAKHGDSQTWDSWAQFDEPGPHSLTIYQFSNSRPTTAYEQSPLPGTTSGGCIDPYASSTSRTLSFTVGPPKPVPATSSTLLPS